MNNMYTRINWVLKKWIKIICETEELNEYYMKRKIKCEYVLSKYWNECECECEYEYEYICICLQN